MSLVGQLDGYATDKVVGGGIRRSFIDRCYIRAIRRYYFGTVTVKGMKRGMVKIKFGGRNYR